jgi:SAM-dependent methyltransferase
MYSLPPLALLVACGVPTCPACKGVVVAKVGLLSKERYRLWRCAHCRSQFYLDEGTSQDPSEDDQYWEAYKFNVYGDEEARHAFNARYGQLLLQAERHAGTIESVLDVGCGIGNFVEYATESGLHAVGIDVSDSAVEFARSKGLNVHHTDDLDSIVSPKSVDALTMWDVVEHLVEPRQVLRALAPKVRHGGALLFETPDADFPVRSILLVVNRLTAGRLNLTGPMYYWEHKIYFTEDGLRALLDSVGVDLVYVARATSVRQKMSRQFAANASKGSWKARVLKVFWPLLERIFRLTGKGNKLLVIGRRR